MTISIDGGSKVEASAQVWIQAAQTLKVGPWLVMTCFDLEEAIGTGEFYNILFIQEAERTQERILQLAAVLKRIEVTVEYKSIYNEKWILSWKWPLAIVPPESNAT
ncbi:MAG: hypothetical protein O7E51_07230 [Acidobacteria bacterium]|nr:hypothetical protein [Acidobacteriota bacterium]